MIIDFHTHAFPDAIAVRAIDKLARLSHTTPCHNGTVADLKRAMNEGGVDMSVLLPVVTAPKQFDSINAFAASHNGREGIISFGGIHPDCENTYDKLKQIKSMGLKGIKLHPDYQNTFVDDEKYILIISQAVELGLIVTLHAGVDVGYPDTVHCTPERSLNMLKAVYGDELNIPRPQIVFAHMDGADMYDDVMKYLAGINVFFDTAYCLDKMPAQDVVKLIRTHGAQKMLFATDSPWGEPKKFVRILNELSITQEERRLISHENAQKLLDL